MNAILRSRVLPLSMALGLLFPAEAFASGMGSKQGGGAPSGQSGPGPGSVGPSPKSTGTTIKTKSGLVELDDTDIDLGELEEGAPAPGTKPSIRPGGPPVKPGKPPVMKGEPPETDLEGLDEELGLDEIPSPPSIKAPRAPRQGVEEIELDESDSGRPVHREGKHFKAEKHPHPKPGRH